MERQVDVIDVKRDHKELIALFYRMELKALIQRLLYEHNCHRSVYKEWVSLVKNYKVEFKKQEATCRLLYLLRDLGIVSAHAPAIKVWIVKMSLLSEQISSNAW